jgi:hypothetical protein
MLLQNNNKNNQKNKQNKKIETPQQKEKTQTKNKIFDTIKFFETHKTMPLCFLSLCITLLLYYYTKNTILKTILGFCILNALLIIILTPVLFFCTMNCHFIFSWNLLKIRLVCKDRPDAPTKNQKLLMKIKMKIQNNMAVLAMPSVVPFFLLYMPCLFNKILEYLSEKNRKKIKMIEKKVQHFCVKYYKKGFEASKKYFINKEA